MSCVLVPRVEGWPLGLRATRQKEGGWGVWEYDESMWHPVVSRTPSKPAGPVMEIVAHPHLETLLAMAETDRKVAHVRGSGGDQTPTCWRGM